MPTIRTMISVAAVVGLLLGLVGAAMWAATPSDTATPEPSAVSITVTEPADGTVVSGTVTIRAELNVPQDVGAVILHFFVGEADLGPVCPGCAQKDWNTLGWTDKEYPIIARVYRWDREKNARGEELAASPAVKVVVDNSPK